MEKITKPLDTEHVNKEYCYKIYTRHINNSAITSQCSVYCTYPP